MLSITFLFLGLVAAASAGGLPDFLQAGQCANVHLQDNFDLEKYGGRWYQTDIIENPFQPFQRCINSFYDFSGDDDKEGFQVTTEGIDSNDQHHQMTGNIYPTDTFPKAHMHLDFPNVIGNPYKVIETDYETYSCVYSCIDWSGYKTEFGFVFSRTPENSGPATEKCASVFEENGVNFSHFISVPQSSDCEYES